ncbi:MAG: prepilin peptidase [Dethiobacter sp.]|jgi:leader peptidase (prepilin peptidase)/N-methyltransferase|nr:prepilin peptidase [Dethiobacter sp.]
MSTEHFLSCFLFFLFGLCVGSFINVLAYRLPRRISLVKPPSSCRSCRRRLSAPELIPVLGYLALQGRCLKCGAPISLRYPLVELATAMLFMILYTIFGLTISLAAHLLLAVLLLAISLIDLDQRIIPNTLVGIGLGGGLLFQLPGLIVLWTDLPGWTAPFRPFTDALSGLLLGGGLLLIIILVSRGGMGAGDMKLMALIGFYVGLRGTAVVMMLGFTMGALVGLILIAARRLTRKDALPFGPFLSAAALIEIFWGSFIWSWYVNLLR